MVFRVLVLVGLFIERMGDDVVSFWVGKEVRVGGEVVRKVVEKRACVWGFGGLF